MRNNSAISITPSSSQTSRPLSRVSAGPGYKPFDKEPARRQKPIATAAAKPYCSQVPLTNQVSLSRLPRVKSEHGDRTSPSENSNSSDSRLGLDQRVDEVRLEDMVGEVSPGISYERHDDVDATGPKAGSSDGDSRSYLLEEGPGRANVQSTPQQEKMDPVTVSVKRVNMMPEVTKPSSIESRSSFERSLMERKENESTSSDDIVIEEVRSSISGQLTSSQGNVNTKPSIELTETSKVPPSVPAKEADVANKGMFPEDPHGMHQGYPYAQYPRYFIKTCQVKLRHANQTM